MIKKINENKIFEEVYIILIYLIALFGWYFKTQYGLMIIITINLIAILSFNDFKYMIPSGLGIIFSIGTDFSVDTKIGPLIGAAIIYFLTFIIYILRNGINFKNFKSYKGLLILGILSFIPLIYHNTIFESINSGILDSNSKILYFLYASYIFYVFLYFLLALAFDENSLRVVFKSIGYMSILLSFECILHVLTVNFEKGYRLGWGHCNEAGILILFSLPFLIKNIIKAERKRDLIIPMLKLLIVIAGIICSTSRGTYLFGIIEIFALGIYTLIVSKQRKTIIISSIIIVLICLLVIQLKFGILNSFNKIIDLVFVRGLSMDDRFRLYKESLIVWNNDIWTRLFGAGMIAELTKEGFEDMNTFIMFHSTFFQCLATTGLFGVLALGYHFFERYRQLKILEKKELYFILIGFITVDLYGLIDNTYGMYYFMIPIVMIMAAFDSYINYKEAKN